MNPDHISTYRDLKQEIRTAEVALRDFQGQRDETGPLTEVENLSRAERVERLAGLIKLVVENPEQQQSMFGARSQYDGKTPYRRVETPDGDAYFVRLGLFTCKDGFRQMPRTHISAEWAENPDLSGFNYNESAEHSFGYMPHEYELKNLEQSLEAYLSGVPVELRQ